MGDPFQAIFNPSSMSGGKAPSGTQMNQQVMDQYFKNIPEFLNVINDPANADKMTAADLAMLQKYGVPMAQIGNQITAANAQSGADINKALLTGTGAEAARAAVGLEAETNPTLALAKSKSADLMNSINLNGLSGGERAEVERALGQSATATGTLGLDNATTAVQNAMSYGDRMAQKRQELNQYVGTGANVANQGVNPVGIALGGTSAPQGNFGTSQFQSASDTAKQNQTLGTSLMGNLSQLQAATVAPQAEASWKNSERYAMDQIGANA